MRRKAFRICTNPFMKLPMAAGIALALSVPGSGRARDDDLPQPRVDRGIRHLSGGVGLQEERAMNQVAHRYSTRIVFARPDGAFLSRLDLRVRRDGRTLVQEKLRGPMFFANLKPGTYQVEVEHEDWQNRTVSVHVPVDGHVELLLTMAPSPHA